MSADLHVLHVAHLTGLYYSALATALVDEKELESKMKDPTATMEKPEEKNRFWQAWNAKKRRDEKAGK